MYSFTTKMKSQPGFILSCKSDPIYIVCVHVCGEGGGAGSNVDFLIS